MRTLLILYHEFRCKITKNAIKELYSIIWVDNGGEVHGIPLGQEGIRSGTEVAEELPSYQASTNAGPSTRTLSPATTHLCWLASVPALPESLRCSNSSLSAIASDSGFCLSYLWWNWLCSPSPHSIILHSPSILGFWFWLESSREYSESFRRVATRVHSVWPILLDSLDRVRYNYKLSTELRMCWYTKSNIISYRKSINLNRLRVCLIAFILKRF